MDRRRSGARCVRWTRDGHVRSGGQVATIRCRLGSHSGPVRSTTHDDDDECRRAEAPVLPAAKLLEGFQRQQSLQNWPFSDAHHFPTFAKMARGSGARSSASRPLPPGVATSPCRLIVDHRCVASLVPYAMSASSSAVPSRAPGNGHHLRQPAKRLITIKSVLFDIKYAVIIIFDFVRRHAPGDTNTAKTASELTFGLLQRDLIW